MKKKLLSLLLAILLLLSSCGLFSRDEEPGVTTLIYANLTENGVDRAAVEAFNAAHEDVKIEVRDYFDERGQTGKQRLLAELALGRVPDIIDLGYSWSGLPYRTMARKDYLADLWPFIENDPELGREGVWETPLKAAEVDGGLYMLFKGASVHTVVGAESVVGDRYSWNLEDLLAAFDTMPADSTIFEYFQTKKYMFNAVFSMTIEEYVNWETGECSFDGEKFRAVLQFVNTFPETEPAIGADMTAETLERILTGRQMLADYPLSRPQDIPLMDAYFGQGGRAAFVGYPTEDGSVGSAFSIQGTRLAMSSVCKNKEAAWEFMRALLLPQFKKASDLTYANYIPVNRADYDYMIKVSRRKSDAMYNYLGGPFTVEKATAEEVARFEDFINSVERITIYDTRIYDLVWEIAGPYFAGDWTLDKTVDQIQRRVKLYVDEQR